MRNSRGMLLGSREEEVLGVKAGDLVLQRRLLLQRCAAASGCRPSKAHTGAGAGTLLGGEAGHEAQRTIMGRGSTIKSKANLWFVIIVFYMLHQLLQVTPFVLSCIEIYFITMPYSSFEKCSNSVTSLLQCVIFCSEDHWRGDSPLRPAAAGACATWHDHAWQPFTAAGQCYKKKYLCHHPIFTSTSAMSIMSCIAGFL